MELLAKENLEGCLKPGGWSFFPATILSIPSPSRGVDRTWSGVVARGGAEGVEEAPAAVHAERSLTGRRADDRQLPESRRYVEVLPASLLNHSGGVDGLVVVQGPRLSQLDRNLEELTAMYKKVVNQNRGLRADYRSCEEMRREAEVRGDRLERELQEARGTTPVQVVVSAVETPSHAVRSAHMNVPDDVSPRAAAASSQHLWQAMEAIIPTPVLAALRQHHSVRRSVAEAEFERTQRVELWEALRETVDTTTFAAVAHCVGDKASGVGGVGRDAEPARPVCVTRRLFESAAVVPPLPPTFLLPSSSTQESSWEEKADGRRESFERGGGRDAAEAARPAPFTRRLFEVSPRTSGARNGECLITPRSSLADGAPSSTSTSVVPLVQDSPSVRERVRALEVGGRSSLALIT